ncbi:MAG: argininosuccinate lyase [Armatimonadetes bacterium]|nr:argininosuccinate lyase [Armatimonadota bacterium]
MSHSDQPAGDKLWGGRFSARPDPRIEAFTHSLPFDRRMAAQDVRGSIAHCRMLGRQGILSAEDAAAIEAGLREIQAEIEAGVIIEGAEDIHTWVEMRLREKIGPVAGRLHSARSRNDQVATDTRLYLRERAQALDTALARFQAVLLEQAGEHEETVLPGYTHLQHAQPVVLAHHLLAYFWMLERDRDRLADWATRASALPLGAAALAGTPYPIDRKFVARELGFARVCENSLDAISDRDFVLELAAVLTILQVHLSRLAEEIVLWSTREFGFIELSDRVATGSSIMPQKKNPDVAELARGKTGRVVGNLTALLTVMKGLPLAYNSDMQEDKERIFDSLDTVEGCAQALTLVLETATFCTERMRAATVGDFSTATDLADYLALRGVPFREAHAAVGQLVRRLEEQGRTLESLTGEELAAAHPAFAGAPADLVSVDASVRARRSPGGTAPEEVRRQLAQARAAWEARGA